MRSSVPAAAQVAENYRKSDILMYGDALRLPSRTAVIEIIRDFQKILFPAYYGDRDLLKLPPEQYSALLMGHVYDKLLRQLELVMPEGEEGARRAEKVCEAMMERLPHIQELLLKDLTANYNGDPAASEPAGDHSVLPRDVCYLHLSHRARAVS